MSSEWLRRRSCHITACAAYLPLRESRLVGTMIEDRWAFDTRGHERTLLHIEFLSPGDSAGLVRPHRLAQRHVWQELQSARRPDRSADRSCASRQRRPAGSGEPVCGAGESCTAMVRC